jgi:hypothetical protein
MVSLTLYTDRISDAVKLPRRLDRTAWQSGSGSAKLHLYQWSEAHRYAHP